MAPARGASPRADSARRALFADHRRMEWRAGPAMGSRCGRRSTASWPGIPLSRMEGLRQGHENISGDGRSHRRYYVRLLTVIGVEERVAPISIDATRFAINARVCHGGLINDGWFAINNGWLAIHDGRLLIHGGRSSWTRNSGVVMIVARAHLDGCRTAAEQCTKRRSG